MSAMVAFIIGNQPLPSLSMRRRLRPVSVPENRMGGPPGCTGFGSHQMSWNDTVGESKEAEPGAQRAWHAAMVSSRSEEHTSELQSLMRISYAVFCLKKKKKNKNQATYTQDCST